MNRASTAPDRPPPRPPEQIDGQGPLRCATATHSGLIRQRNEDRVHADPDRGLFIVVDGMGGEAAGEEAAIMALDAVLQRLDPMVGRPEERIRDAIVAANDEILGRARRDPSVAGMGCVLTIATVENSWVTVGHVGDSRLYLLREGTIEKMTHDHSPIGEREDRGELDEIDAMRHPRRNEVYRSIGAQPRGPFDPGFIEVSHFRMKSDDALLLCSDGLSDLVTSREILGVVETSRDDDAVAQGLVKAALAKGGKDNVSVVFVAGPRFHLAAGRRSDRERLVETEPVSRSPTPTRWVQFVLGGVFGALITLATVWVGSPKRADVGGIVDTPIDRQGSRLLHVGPGRRFTTIGDALGAAHAGDTVLVRPGTYREQVRMEEAVTLLSTEPGSTILEPTSETGPIVAVVAEGLGSGRIGGFTIRGTRGAPLDIGVRLRDAAVAIDDVEIHEARVAGVVVEGGRAPVLSANWIHDNRGAGVIVRHGAAARLTHNRIEDNGHAAHEASPGVELESDARVELVSNVIVGNAGAGVRGLPRSEERRVLADNLFEAGGKSSHPPLAARAKASP